MSSKEYMKAYREKNREKLIAYNRLYHTEHKEKWQQYNETNKESRHLYSAKKKQDIKSVRQQYNKSHRKEIREQQKKYNEVNKDRVTKYRTSLGFRMDRWKVGARTRGINWDIDVTLEFLESLPFVCHYTGVKLTLDSRQTNTVSLDRVDSSKGYSIDNLVLCCAFVNIMKRDMSKEQFIKTCHLIAKQHPSI